MHSKEPLWIEAAAEGRTELAYGGVSGREPLRGLSRVTSGVVIGASVIGWVTRSDRAQEFQLFLHPYVDGELGVDETVTADALIAERADRLLTDHLDQIRS